MLFVKIPYHLFVQDVNTQPIEGMYDPAEFTDLDVAQVMLKSCFMENKTHDENVQDVKELFDYIVRYVPQKIELDYKLKPFIPDFIPAVGDIDAFIKVESNNPLELGLTVLDEPSAKQSDPNIMELQLRFCQEKDDISFILKCPSLGH